ncbi:MAG: hypothetical protein PHS92_05220 [Candidatus Gracilibacteria bacterium]|nr:hypothetical protein [Candidatus Gracilibacteria bacterium]
MIDLHSSPYEDSSIFNSVDMGLVSEEMRKDSTEKNFNAIFSEGNNIKSNLMEGINSFFSGVDMKISHIEFDGEIEHAAYEKILIDIIVDEKKALKRFLNDLADKEFRKYFGNSVSDINRLKVIAEYKDMLLDEANKYSQQKFAQIIKDSGVSNIDLLLKESGMDLVIFGVMRKIQPFIPVI